MKSPEEKLVSANEQGSGGGAGRAGEAGTAGAAAGASPSNTAPANSNKSSETQILRSGIDTLILSYRGELKPELEVCLSELKRLAQHQDEKERAYAQISLAGQLFTVKAQGFGIFPYVLANHWYRLSLGRVQKSSVPAVYAQVYSEVLTYEGCQTALKTLSLVIDELALVEPETVSRVDVCADFTTAFDLSTFDTRSWVSRAKLKSQYEVGGEFSGWAFGMGGDVAARLYNKSLELVSSGKAHLLELYRACGWDEVSRIWRLEFEVKRNALGSLGIRQFADLESNLPELWSYLTANWLRLTLPSLSDERSSRWPLHVLWVDLQGVDWGRDPLKGLKRVSTATLPHGDACYLSYISALTGFMALHGIDDPSKAASLLADQSQYWLSDLPAFFGPVMT
jgi:hypothetical protein